MEYAAQFTYSGKMRNSNIRKKKVNGKITCIVNAESLEAALQEFRLLLTYYRGEEDLADVRKFYLNWIGELNVGAGRGVMLGVEMESKAWQCRELQRCPGLGATGAFRELSNPTEEPDCDENGCTRFEPFLVFKS